MIIVHFDPPLEKSHFKMVLPKVQAVFPDWTWCGNTGTPTVRKREDILTGALNNRYMIGIGALMYDKHYGRENDCLMYTSGWSKEDTEAYERQGKKVEIVDGWSLMIHKPLNTDDVFNSLNESRFKKIIKESIDEFEWAKGLGDYDINGWYVSEPVKRVSMLYGNLYYITLKDNNQVEVMTYWIAFDLNNYRDVPEKDLKNVVMGDYINMAKHEVKQLEYHTGMLDKMEGPYYWGTKDVLDYIQEGYFIKLS
jgi:hypothetical protein